MVRLKLWQWGVLVLPIVAIVGFLLIAAGQQIHAWGLSWIWGVFTLVLVGWRWLLVKWTQPALTEMTKVMNEVARELEDAPDNLPPSTETDVSRRAALAIEDLLQAAQNDPPLWEDWPCFWSRCQELVTAIAHVYYPEVPYPLLNIYIPQAYTLLRGTVDDLDQWMQRLSPALNQMTIGQAYQAYETYRRLEPSAQKLWRAWNWAQWILNPVAALARQVSQRSGDQATQQLIVNLGQLLREATLRNLGRQAIVLYGNTAPPLLKQPASTPTLPQAKTQTIRELLSQATSPEQVTQPPVNLLIVGRTGAGKSSLINTLFRADRAAVDVLPSTDQIQSYRWEAATGESLVLWDTPGYEQVDRADLREQVLTYGTGADLVLLVTPALDPALQMDVDFLKLLKEDTPDLPVLMAVTQVDRLRPFREWQPPYDWQWGDRPKEVSIREATQYRSELLGVYCDRVLPIVTGDLQAGRPGWGTEALAIALLETIAPAQQLRLARFLRNLEARTVATAQIIDRYRFQMATTQGLTALLKSPVLQFISTLTTGTPNLAYLLAEKIPVEQLPVVIGKLQMAYDLFLLLNSEAGSLREENPSESIFGKMQFDLLTLWPLLLENAGPADRNAWAFGHVLVEYWTQGLNSDQLRERFAFYRSTVTG
ncbi:MAG: GTPase [Leptolyngbyaceae cyanobacterium bins.59]|nr:GTPase [Leptolyngbyaceae cyanobacterium bins.59]